MEKSQPLKKDISTFDTEKAREILEKVRKEEMEPLYDASFSLIENLGKLMIGIGKLQKSNNEAYNFVMKVGENPLPFFSIIIKDMPATKVKEVVQTFLEILSVMSEIKNFESMNADMKIDVGEKLVGFISKLKSTPDKEV